MSSSMVGGRYRFLRELGRGGMATVWLALDEKHQREVAVKVLRPDVSALAGAERFLREIELTASLNHPHILPLLDSGAEGALVFYVMPYVPGGSLRRLLAAGPVPLEAVVRIAGEVASALDHAHAHGIVHRDVKPENILFSEGLAVVSDFGIARALSDVAPARMTATGLPLGTPGYMSPEQALGAKELDGRTDVYALGSVVYEMLVGETPACWPGPDEVALGRLADLPPAHREALDRCPGRVEQVLARALALRLQHRFPSAGALAGALAAASERTAGFTDEQVRQLLHRAAELQDEPAPDLLTIGAVEQVAAQVGIPPVHVRQAAHELERAEAPASLPADGSPAVAGDWRRLRTSWNRLVATETIPGVMPPEAHTALVAEIERELGIVGQGSVLGNSLTWTPVRTHDPDREILVKVSAAEGRTDIRILEQLRLRGVRALAGPVGGVVGLILTAPLSVDLGGLGPLVALGGALLSAFGGLRLGMALQAAERGPGLARLSAALARMARQAIDRAEPPAEIPVAPTR